LNAQQITWDLSELFSGITDPKISQALTDATVMATIFEKKYRGKIASLSPEGLLVCLQEIEE
jgi:hypothetical protein